MYSPRAVIAAFVLSTLVSAIQVTSPDRDTEWSSGTSSQTISWKAVSTDPDNFVIQLVNQQGFLSDGPVTLSKSQDTGSSDQTNSATVSYPNGNWPVGHGFQINLMSSEKSNSAILAQSGQFNITSGGSSSGSNTNNANAGSTSSGRPPMTLTNNAAAQQPSSTSAAYTGNASGGVGDIPNAVNSSGAASSQFGQPGAFISLLISVAGLFGVMI